jgi:hypothetical protein
MWLLAAIGAAHAADAITFLRMVRDHGLAAERNPLVAHLAASGDLFVLVVLKALLVVEVVCIVTVVERRTLAGAVALAAFAVVAGLAGACANVGVLLAR